MDLLDRIREGAPYTYKKLKYTIDIYKFLTLDMIRAHPEMKWLAGHIINYSHISIEDYIKCKGGKLSSEDYITMMECGLTPIKYIVKFRENVPNGRLEPYDCDLDTIFWIVPQRKWNWQILAHYHMYTIDMIRATDPKYIDWNILSQNCNLTLDYILQHVDENWDWAWLASNIPFGDILATPHLPWDLGAAYHNSSVTFPMLCQYKNIYNWTDQQISQNPNITQEIVDANPHIKWDWLYLTCIANPIIPPKNHHMYQHYMAGIQSDSLWQLAKTQAEWEVASSVAETPMEVILENPHLPWVYKNVCENCNVTWEHIRDNPLLNTPDHYPNISRNPNITWYIVNKNPHMPWDYMELIYNPMDEPVLHSEEHSKMLVKRFMEICGKELEAQIYKKYIKTHLISL